MGFDSGMVSSPLGWNCFQCRFNFQLVPTGMGFRSCLCAEFGPKGFLCTFNNILEKKTEAQAKDIESKNEGKPSLLFDGQSVCVFV